MNAKALKPRLPKGPIAMDPNCAICHAPASRACDCEARGLEVAIRQAENQMMRSIYNDIRAWVRGRAQDYVLEYFRLMAERRKNAHTAQLDQITAQAFYHYNAPPHPKQIAEAQAALKRGIDEDWQASVQRYPDVLEYFYGLVEFTLPDDDDPAVKDPPLSALNGQRKSNRRNNTVPPVAALPPASYSPQAYQMGLDRRGPVRMDHRLPRIPPDPSSYYPAFM